MAQSNIAGEEKVTTSSVTSSDNTANQMANKIWMWICVALVTVAFLSHLIHTIDLFYQNVGLTLRIGLLMGFVSLYFSFHGGIRMGVGNDNNGLLWEYCVHPRDLLGWMFLVWEATTPFTKFLIVVTIFLMLCLLVQRVGRVEIMRGAWGFRFRFGN